MQKGQIVEIRPEEIDLNKFKNYGVFVSQDLSEIIIVKAKINREKDTKCYGVIPDNLSRGKCYGVIPNNSSSGTFNCRVGDYHELTHDVYIHCPNMDSLKAAAYFNVRYTYTDVGKVFMKNIPHKHLNVFINSGNRYLGFFTTKNKLCKEIDKIRNDYMNNLFEQMKKVVDNTSVERMLTELEVF